jgi:signal transduction histidine kinase
MNNNLEDIKKTIEHSENLSEPEKEALLNSIKSIDKEIAIIEFKLQRTEKVKRTTSVLLEETIDELEKKRTDAVEANEALKKSIEELKAAQAQLIQSEKMASLGELTAGIAHEIQNPLNFVNNFSEVSKELIEEMNEELEKGDIGEAKEIGKDIDNNLEKIHHHGKRAEAIVKGMLQHSRTNSGEKELTDINALADEYLRLSYHGLRAKDKSFNADFKLDADESLPKINVVPQDIGRVLLNLINNAFYAVDKKAKENIEGYKPEVVISTSSSPLPEGGNRGVEIRVQDNGPGIPPEIKDKIFQPFFTTKPTGSGTGLGLSLSYDIIKAHGGEIKVNSAEGEGTEFIIQLNSKS